MFLLAVVTVIRSSQYVYAPLSKCALLSVDRLTTARVHSPPSYKMKNQ